MNITIREHCIIVERDGGPKIKPSRGWGGRPVDPDSGFWLQVRNKLRKIGLDVVRKRMASDGHMVDDLQQYLRDRQHAWCAYFGSWAVRNAVDDYNSEEGCVVLINHAFEVENNA